MGSRPESAPSRQTEQSEKRKPEDASEPPDFRQPGAAEEIVTPIEAGAQAQAEHEFQTHREIPPSCKRAIVSVNGEDVDEVPLGHEPAA